MRKVKIRHERLPGIGELFELPLSSGGVITVVSQRSGRRDITACSDAPEEAAVTISLTRAEATALAALLVGAHIELTTNQGD